MEDKTVPEDRPVSAPRYSTGAAARRRRERQDDSRLARTDSKQADDSGHLELRRQMASNAESVSSDQTLGVHAHFSTFTFSGCSTPACRFECHCLVLR